MGGILGGGPALTGFVQNFGKFVLINLCGGGVFRFDFFPNGIDLSQHANWPEQDTTTGPKPLFYSNRDPRRIEVREVWLDKTDTNESLKPQMDALFHLQDETCEGTPPPLLAVWGDRQQRVILDDIRFEEVFHAPAGFPIRARCAMTLKELQEGDR